MNILFPQADAVSEKIGYPEDILNNDVINGFYSAVCSHDLYELTAPKFTYTHIPIWNNCII